MRAILLIVVCTWMAAVDGQVVKPMVTHFPSLSIRPGSRAMGMGDNGLAISSGTESILYNPAITAFTNYQHQLSFSYMPWLTGISNDVRMMRVGYLHSLTETSSMGINLSYLDMGQIDLRDDNGATLASYRARDYHADLSYALQLNEQHSLSVSMKFLGQNQFGNIPSQHYSFCGDLSYYGFIKLGSDNQKFSFGAVLTNLGPKEELPAGAGIGIGYTRIYESGDALSVGLDASRLISDDWKGVRVTGGAEFGFAESFFIRAGLSLENKEKGDRKYFSLGAGYKGYVHDQRLDIDMHYLIPFGFTGGVSPFQNSYGLTLGINIGNFQ